MSQAATTLFVFWLAATMLSVGITLVAFRYMLWGALAIDAACSACMAVTFIFMRWMA